jgi:hypothetical protein
VSQAVKKAKLFMNGRSQAVRLPKEFRMPGTEVYIERRGDEIVLTAVSAADAKGGKPLKTIGDLMDYIDDVGPVSEEFARAVREYRKWTRQQPPRDVSW